MTSQVKQRIYVEALTLTTKHVSGIGYALANTVMELCTDKDITNKYDIVLFGPKVHERRIKQWNFPNTTYSGYSLKQRLVTTLNLLGLLPSIDRWLGLGVYLFGNYVNYPVTSRSRSITYIHDLSYMRYPEYVRPKVRRVLRQYVPNWIKRTNHVVTVSEHAKSEIMHFYHTDSNKITVIPNGINPEEFYRRSDQEVDRVKQAYGITGEYILFLSNIEPRKNLQRLVEAYQILPKELRDQYALLIVGSESWLNEPINRAIDDALKSGAKIMRPDKYVIDTDIPALHSGATLLAHPALYEGFGIAPLQAMACGTPVLVARRSSLPEVVSDAGLYINNPESVEEISTGLQTLLSDKNLREELSLKGLIQSQKFLWKDSEEKLKVLISKLSE